MTETLTFTAAPDTGGTTEQHYQVQFTRTSPTADWPGNRETAEVTPPTNEAAYCRFEMFVNAQGISGRIATSDLTFSAQVVEIEMEDGTIFTMGDGVPPIEPNQYFMGSIHVPWEGNVDESIIYHGHFTHGTPHVYRLKRITGDVIEDISPVLASKTYGTFRGHFGIRAFDNDRNYMVFCGTAGSNPSAALYKSHAVFVSSNGGDTWTTVLGPLDSYLDQVDYFLGWGGWEAAFASDDHNCIYIWGGTPPYNYNPPAEDPFNWSPGSYLIAYTDDFGATVVSKEGNLVTMFNNGSDDPLTILGIAGGPIA